MPSDEYTVSEWALRLYHTYMQWQHRRSEYPDWSTISDVQRRRWLAAARESLARIREGE